MPHRVLVSSPSPSGEQGREGAEKWNYQMQILYKRATGQLLGWGSTGNLWVKYRAENGIFYFKKPLKIAVIWVFYTVFMSIVLVFY